MTLLVTVLACLLGVYLVVAMVAPEWFE